MAPSSLHKVTQLLVA
ncbi:unnamed protein product [Linum tenue]|uniref:Uncharacterized protein n=1 Tax=Linum tenue TaxID=586396 RepID=A0AAV0QVZ4_9ROSI|nr:unnamed protein product [Linum tenue]